MKLNKSLWCIGIGTVVLGTAAPSVSLAQGGSFGGGYGPPLKTIPPPKEFATSEEHYAYLLEQAKGGTKHTLATVPRWDGLWNTAGNTHMDAFVDAPGFTGKVREGVLTPEYAVAYKERWREQTELGEVQYDRLTHCEPPGYPRFMLEPYTHEFINLPEESYLINDYGPGIRRVYIGKEHSNLYGTHSWYGDTIGFWDGNKLVTNTKYLLPADFTRWAPMTSNAVRVDEDLGAQAVSRRNRAARGSGHFLRQVRVREAGECRVRVPPRDRARTPATASSIGNARGAATTSSRRTAPRPRSCPAKKDTGMRVARRCSRSYRASLAIRSTTPRCRAVTEE